MSFGQSRSKAFAKAQAATSNALEDHRFNLSNPLRRNERACRCDYFRRFEELRSPSAASVLPTLKQHAVGRHSIAKLLWQRLAFGLGEERQHEQTHQENYAKRHAC